MPAPTGSQNCPCNTRSPRVFSGALARAMSTVKHPNATAFTKLSHQLNKLSHRPRPENVHKFRTLSRRVEALLEGLITSPVRNDRKLLKLLARLRKKAGRVRDLDVQISALRNLRIPQERVHKAEFISALTDERRKREDRLASAFDQDTLHELGKRIRRAAHNLPADCNPLQAARFQLLELTRNNVPVTETTLHRYRIFGKRARYLAEQSPADPAASRLVADLKQLQDVIGDWHDWLKLTDRANKFFEGQPNSVLLSTLRANTRNKFLEAVNALTRARTRFIEGEASAPKPAKKAASATQSGITAA